ncbi:ribosome silencing factor [Leptolyngbya sp. FACHB-671]|uniref:ribosome silencing factor n=1 Tax=Leptolyngbya sp. FACHB-671 TaxID=2692812 RepID=UPI0016855177|nr:ribosome silencing factor [Leptolyngbya sp. FACHB-671]MBD2067444.1 ribosome silencing factor [Leptolyngbya sp. FACHB-671]
MTNYSNARPVSPAVANPGAVYQPVTDDSSRELALTIAQAADDRKGGDIVLLKVSEVSYLADYFVVATGFSSAQVRAIARSIEDEVSEKWHRYPTQTEGQTEGSWVLLDYGDVIAHIFMPDEREFYNLEAFWGHAERIDFAPNGAMTDQVEG